MRSARFLPILALGALAAACGDATGPEPGEPITELPRALTEVEEAVIQASNRFGLQLMREAAAAESEKPNVVISPLSASMALGMTLNGAAGETFQAMRSTLGFGDLAPAEINAAYRETLDLLQGLDPEVEFTVGNSVWSREGFPFLESFFETVQASFDARVESLDFDDPAALSTINGWVEDATNGRIPSILDRIDPMEVMFLINAIWFDGRWTTEFDPSETRQADFRRADGTTVQVPLMMRRDATVPRVFREDYTAAELTYGGGAFGLVILLPEEGTPATEVAASMDESEWSALVEGLAEGELARVGLPRFTTSYDVELNDILTDMGMGIAFNNGADFSNLSPLGEEMFITKVRQKTLIEVDEAGTRAAAATSVGVRVTSLPPQLVADRPFLFVLRERLSGTILFMGLVGDPTVEE